MRAGRDGAERTGRREGLAKKNAEEDFRKREEQGKKQSDSGTLKMRK